MSERQRGLPQQNEVLFGHDGTAAISAFEVEDDKRVRIFSRHDAALREEIVLQGTQKNCT